MVIDEEINSLIKTMEHEIKRLFSIHSGYQEKMGDDLDDTEFKERKMIFETLNTCNKSF